MLGFVSAHLPWNATLNHELLRSYNALRSDLVLLSASTLSNICRRQYSLTVDTIKKQLPSTDTVSLALDGWGSTNELAIMSVIAYYMDRNWALREVQLVFDGVDYHFFSYYKSQLRIIGQGSTYWGKASHTFESSSWAFWAYRWLCTWNHDWWCLIKLVDVPWTTVNTWGLRNLMACFAKPHTMYGARHSACFRCIHEHSRDKRPHQVMGSPWARSTTWRELKYRHSEESKTSKGWQGWNQQGVSHEPRFGKDKWERTHLKNFWKYWNCTFYSSECLRYWLHWHLVVKTGTLTVK